MTIHTELYKLKYDIMFSIGDNLDILSPRAVIDKGERDMSEVALHCVRLAGNFDTTLLIGAEQLVVYIINKVNISII